jgi:methyl-accepting chemotaxis protein
MPRSHLGVGGKLNLALGVILLGLTATFGVSYAFLERANVFQLEREHLKHMASLARLYLSDVRDRKGLETVVSEFNEKLASARRAPHRLVVEDDRGMAVAANSVGKGLPAAGGGPDPLRQSPPVEVDPSLLRVELPLQLQHYTAAAGDRPPARLVLFESLPRIGAMFRASLIRHLAFAGTLAGLAMLAVGWLTHRLVVRPVRDLVAVTDEIASDGLWGPVAPGRRRRDEIGILGDHLAEMSRRLVGAVRAERYGSAHLVVERVRREIAGPLRRSATKLATLAELLPKGSEAARTRAEVASEIADVADAVRGLEQLPQTPPG